MTMAKHPPKVGDEIQIDVNVEIESQLADLAGFRFGSDSQLILSSD